ncbi:MAG: UDP-2,4-diacetamido-2,4,6-trideoxy-beta-L-altropyranose hydrolase [Lachnospiraceae bacterium]|nr:UDP-2,4-diacetamido-2,4,6-trideoxy-beta-L-altropyranose hydrolase [Lachnospiraceae bacterium]
MIGFRVDMNKQIASGHLMRSLTIAKEVRKLGEEVLFLSSDNGVERVLSSAGFSYINLNCDYSDWESSLDRTLEIIQSYRIRVLFTDSYLVSGHVLSELNRHTRVAYIDDFIKKTLDVSLLLVPTQSLDTSVLTEMYRDKPVKLLVGSEYLIIREEFLNPTERADRDRIFLTTGGTDPAGFTEAFLHQAMNHPVLKDKKYTVILGSLYDNTQALKETYRDYPNIRFHQNVTNMGELMKECSFAVSAGGNTLYELICLRIPTVCISLSPDQEALGERLENKGIVSYCGNCIRQPEECTESVISKLSSLIQLTDDERSDLKGRCRSFTDGMGAKRIAKALIEL